MEGIRPPYSAKVCTFRWDYLLRAPFSIRSHFWLAIVQEVLQADWQEVWHSPHPPLAAVIFKLVWLIVLTCFIRTISF
jgi:hypothetical protein